MSNPYVGEIRLFAGNFAPLGWMFCQGQLLPIAENEVLFVLIGTTYGGDGQSTFALPDLRGRVPVHQGQGPGLSPRMLGELGGDETITLAPTQLPTHTHTLRASGAAATGTAPGGALLAATSVASYDPGPGSTAMAASAVGSAGGNQPHENMAPTLALNYIISLFGIFPQQA
ncbi:MULTISPECIES: phage tail protein [Roseateles]|uniref:Microcystin-dependent protein n=1 Tax=Pelomonas aquatica TaxID=431058 RepID=A0ABU1Z8I4_9BURK|nr:MULTISPECIES: tail fiber protein [Roseateles]KQY90602.1 phage tail protein [Pelomonas sp. Root1444]MDR7296934.1 microcystin-dependent protein [Pelomonas aquatica]